MPVYARAAMALPLTFDAHGLVPVIVQDHLTGEIRMFAFATPAAIAEDPRDGARDVLEPLAQRALGEGAHERQRDPRRARSSSTATPTASSTRASRTGPRATPARELLLPVARRRDARAGERAAADAPRDARGRARGAQGRPARRATRRASTRRAPPQSARSSARRPASWPQSLESETDERVVSEAADVLYHLMVGLRWRGIPLRRVLAELARRLGNERPRREGVPWLDHRARSSISGRERAQGGKEERSRIPSANPELLILLLSFPPCVLALRATDEDRARRFSRT